MSAPHWDFRKADVLEAEQKYLSVVDTKSWLLRYEQQINGIGLVASLVFLMVVDLGFGEVSVEEISVFIIGLVFAVFVPYAITNSILLSRYRRRLKKAQLRYAHAVLAHQSLNLLNNASAKAMHMGSEEICSIAISSKSAESTFEFICYFNCNTRLFSLKPSNDSTETYGRHRNLVVLLKEYYAEVGTLLQS